MNSRSAERNDSVEGPSFSFALKLLSTAMVGGLGVLGWGALNSNDWAALGTQGQVFSVMSYLVVLCGYWGVLTSRTRVDGKCIRQTWLWRKEVQLADITRVKLIHVPALSWLIAPRLLVRSGGIGLTTFHVADPRVLEAIKRLAYG
jgi:hypothetical protein